jgi:glycosyltransferase involved in cell wall biosynthesis
MTAQTYAVITPVRDEAENLARLADCMQAQTIQPDAWVIVDNGSVDDTLELAKRLAAEHDWIRAITAEPADVARPGAPIVRAFNVGLTQLDVLPDVVVKLDADVSMGDDYFERILEAFTADPRLGIAGGACFELRDGVWEETFVTGDAVRGASAAIAANAWKPCHRSRRSAGTVSTS